MRPGVVTIQAPTESYDAERNVLTSWRTVATLRGYVLPESGDLVQKLYGIDEQVTDRLIYKGQSDFLVVGNRVVYGNKTYVIVWPQNYTKVMDVKLRLLNV